MALIELLGVLFDVALEVLLSYHSGRSRSLQNWSPPRRE